MIGHVTVWHAASGATMRLASALTQRDKTIDGLHHAAADKNAAEAGVKLGKVKSLLLRSGRSIPLA